ncbi:enoyl-CoA hydratase/isomerase family protein [Paenibacillus sp. GCM10027628]|uniref:enoyl-CoA hydratase/isomerase family protein n=1 Tax=Paenibacillus sp. GCM10027628 TaxID=3273413 RepID=UPI0036295690
MNVETLDCSVIGKTAVIQLNRPPMNALNKQLFIELYQVLSDIEQDDRIQAVIVTGSGERAFAAGADMSEMKDLDAAGMSKWNQISRRAFDKAANIGKPIIAAINGLALGGGCELALCCDFRISSEHAKIALPEINLGIIPGGGGTQRLQRLIGQAKAKELLYFGDMISAQEALDCGLVHKVVPHDALLDAAHEWAAKLADKPAVALRMMKTAVQTGADTDLNDAITIESVCFGNTFTTQDRQEGMTAFFEKRKPNYVGR